MRSVKITGKYGPFYGIETEERLTLVWEEGCYQKFPMEVMDHNREAEEITSLEFYSWMNKHSELMIEEDRT